MSKKSIVGSTVLVSERISKYEIMKKLFGERYISYRNNWIFNDVGGGVVGFPLSLDIVPNNSCNLRCVTCTLTEGQRNNNDGINEKILQAILEEATHYNLDSIKMCGTEPLSSKKTFLNTLSMINKTYAMDVYLQTNGTLLTNDILDNIFDSKITTLCISLDSTTPETYLAVRGKNYFKKLETLLYTIKAMKEYRKTHFPFVQASFCVNPLNFQEKSMFEEKWKDVVQIFVFQDYRYAPSINIKPTDVFEPIFATTCNDPFVRLSIDYNGDVIPCCGTRNKELILGNILNENLYSLWHGEKIVKLRESFLKNPTKLPETCKTCLTSFYRLKDICP